MGRHCELRKEEDENGDEKKIQGKMADSVTSWKFTKCSAGRRLFGLYRYRSTLRFTNIQVMALEFYFTVCRYPVIGV